MAVSEAIQTISRLTPLTDVLLLIDAEVKPVTQRTIDVSAAAGRALAADAMAPARPGFCAGVAGRLGAEPPTKRWAPAVTRRRCSLRTPSRIEAGQPLPAGTDSVAPIDAVKVAGGRRRGAVPSSIQATVYWRRVVTAIRQFRCGVPASDCAPPISRPFPLPGIARITVREPRVRVLPVRGSGIISAAARLVTADIERRGGAARFDDSGRGLDVAMAAESADAIVAIGGTGSGRNDNSVQTLAREGRLAVHGVALTPGETAALGFVGVTTGTACCRDGSMPR